MAVSSPAERAVPPNRRFRATMTVLVLLALAASAWVWRSQGSATDTKGRAEKPVQVVTTMIKREDVPIRLSANGTVTPQQTVAVRPQLSAMIRSVHIREGQFVRQGERLFTLDARTEDANLSRTEGQMPGRGQT